ncbi:MAG: hypothetical protein WBG71_12380 [Leeuwenhoekiella sp.]
MEKQKSDPQKKNNSEGKRQQEETSWMDTDRVVNKAQRIVNSAVNVLEEEIAAGILAAKNIEKKLIDVEEIRSDPDALVNRIRRDSHEVLDLFIDAFASLTNQMNTVVESLKKETEEQAKSHKKKPAKTQKASAGVAKLEPDKPLQPGESTTLAFSLYEDEVKKPKKVELRKADLLGPGNQVINKRFLKIEPKSISLKAKEEQDISITLSVPKNTAPGRYNTLLTDTTDPNICVLLAVEIVAAKTDSKVKTEK